MIFIIQHNLINIDSLTKIQQVIESHHIPHLYIGVIPFSGELVSDVPLAGIDYIPYGSCSLTEEAYKLGWTGLYFDPTTFRADCWYENRTDMLNSDGLVVPVKDAIDFFKSQDPDSDWFIRPCEDLKIFSGHVITAGEASTWLKDAVECESSSVCALTYNTDIVVSSPKTIQAEWRWFVVGGKVISGSMYRRNGQMYTREELDVDVVVEAQTFADKWLPSPCCVMDLALVDNTVKVIEFNTINSSGFYDNNVENIIVALYDHK